MGETKKEIILQADKLCKYFPVKDFFGRRKTVVKAVDQVDLQIRKGETFGLVGESGCGKSTLGRTLIRMYEPTGGTIYFQGQDISSMKGKQLNYVHKSMQIIFQDPYSALDPHHNVLEIIRESMTADQSIQRSEIEGRVEGLLKRVGMKPDDMYKYAYEFSGGQRQRIGIARALSVNPQFLLCDEPISALDVSIQAQVVNMLEDIQEELGLTYLFVAHDLSMVRHISTRIGVMYLGRLVEIAESDELYENPLHPYTKALLSAIPAADPDIASGQQRLLLKGEIPSPMNVPCGCHFHTRCLEANEGCSKGVPEFLEVSPGHFVSCFVVEQARQIGGK